MVQIGVSNVFEVGGESVSNDYGFVIPYNDPVGLDTYHHYLMLRRNKLGEKIGEGSFEVTQKFREAQAKGVEQAQAD